MDDILMHYGVPGMRWGSRKAAEYSRAAYKAKRSADELDFKAKEAAAQGKSTKASKYKNRAAQKKNLSDEYAKKADRFTNDESYRELEYYKHNNRVKKAIASAVGAGVFVVTAPVLLPTMKVGAYFVSRAWRNS